MVKFEYFFNVLQLKKYNYVGLDIMESIMKDTNLIYLSLIIKFSYIKSKLKVSSKQNVTICNCKVTCTTLVKEKLNFMYCMYSLLKTSCLNDFPQERSQ